MSKDKANGDGTSTDVHLVLNGKGGVGKVVVATCTPKSLPCIYTVLTTNGSLVQFLNRTNSISSKCGGGRLWRGARRNDSEVAFGWHSNILHNVLSVGARGKTDCERSAGEHTTFERHYRVSDLARLWGLGREIVRKLVKDDPGVIKIRMRRKKAHTVYSVPESAAQRIHTRLLNVA